MIVELSNKLVQYMSSGEFSPLFLLISFLGGILSSISPCSIGILPIIAGYVGGYGDTNKFKTFIQMLSFVFGLAVVLSIIGVICALTGQVFASFGGAYFVLFIASLILVMGLNLLNIIEIPLPTIISRMPKGNGTSLFIYPFLIGVIFAFAMSPCSTPILAGIMSFAVLTKSIFLAGLMLMCFSLGQGVIVILTGVFASFIKGLRNFASISEVLMKISGVLLILASLIIYIKIFSRFF